MATQAYTYNNNTDDPIMSDGSANFTGVVSATKANRLESSELANLLNGDVGPYGTARAKPPAQIVGSNLSDVFFVSPQGDPYETNNSIRYVAKGYIGDTQKIWVSKGASPQIFFFVEGKLYCANSLEVKEWGKPILSDINVSSSVSLTQLAEIVYFVDGNKLRYLDSGTIGEISKFKVVQEDGTLDDGLPIPASTCIETHVERLCLAGIKDAQAGLSAVYFSDYLDGKTWMLTDSIQVGADGDSIVGLKSWRNNTLLVFKASSVWAIICDPLVDNNGNKLSPAYWTVNKISDSYGAISRETIAQVGNDVWFLSKRGVCSVQRAVAAEENEMQALPISIPIQNYIDRINWNAAHTASAVFYKDKYFLSIPIDGAPSPNIVLIYNTIMKTWQGVWEGTAMRATGYARAYFNGVESLLWRTSDGTVYQLFDDDLDTAYDTIEGQNSEFYQHILTTKSYTWDAPLNEKRALDLEIEFYQSDGLADVFIILDGMKEFEVAKGLNISTSKNLPLQIPFNLSTTRVNNFKFNIRTLPRFRELQVVIYTYNGRATIRNINVNALVMPL